MKYGRAKLIMLTTLILNKSLHEQQWNDYSYAKVAHLDNIVVTKSYPFVIKSPETFSHF